MHTIHYWQLGRKFSHWLEEFTSSDMPVHDFDRVASCSRAQAGRLQHPQLWDCPTPHYSTSSQSCIHINVMKLCRMGKLPAIIYWKDSDRQWTWGSLKSKKKQKNFPPTNEAFLSNINGTERKQGQMLTFADTVISCCRHMIQARAGAKESQPLCLEEVLISQWPGDLFKRTTG